MPEPLGVNVKVGGFVEGASIYPQRNTVADVGTDFDTGMTLPNSPLLP